MNINYSKVTAFIQPTRLEAVEEKLRKLGVPGISITNIRGYGEERNFFNSDLTCECICIEVFIESKKAKEVAQGVMEAAYSGTKGDGIVSISNIESLYRIYTKQPVEFN